MGVPFLFRYFQRHYNNIIDTTSMCIPFHILAIDANCIIYEIIKLNPLIIDFIEIYKLITIKLDLIISSFTPKICIIAFDGNISFAKMIQQRYRRYNTIIEENKFNTCNITPGTLFMKKLDEWINNWIKTNIRLQNMNIVYYSSNENGEGEHKIFSWIKENYLMIKDNTIGIFGIDADLYMLSLLSPMSNNIHIIYFSRNNKYISTLCTTYYTYLSIYELKQCIIYHCMQIHSSGKLILSRKIILRDYIILGFLFGNDYIPCFPSLNLRHEGWNDLLTIYIKLNQSLINNITCEIEWKNIRNLFFELMIDEKLRIQQNVKILQKTSNLTREWEDYILDENDDKTYREKYYELVFYNDLDTDIININLEVRIARLCLEYLYMLSWTWKYYETNNIINDKNMSVYKWNYPPLFLDLVKALDTIEDYNLIYNLQQPEMTNKNKMIQLLYVIPRHSWEAIHEKEIIEKLENKITDMYPEENKVLYIHAFKHYEWESIPLLPYFSINKLINLFE